MQEESDMGKVKKLYIQTHGHFENDASLNIGMAHVATVDNKNLKAEWRTDIPVLTVLIEHSELGWILFDTASHPANMKGHWPERLQKLIPQYTKPEETLEARLKEHNLTPKDIDVVVLSHLHVDHAGGLFLFQHTKAGKNVYVHSKELREALFLTHVGLERNVGAYVVDDFVLPGIAFNPVAEDFQLAEGIEIITLEGDAFGILGMVVHLENSGTLILPQDGVKTTINYGPPAVLPGSIYDSLGFFRSVEKVRKLQEKYNARILFGHDGEDLKKFKISPECYD